MGFGQMKFSALTGEFCAGAPGGTRTPNPLIRSQMLYPIELPVRRRITEKIFGESGVLSSFESGSAVWRKAMKSAAHFAIVLIVRSPFVFLLFDSFVCGATKMFKLCC